MSQYWKPLLLILLSLATASCAMLPGGTGPQALPTPIEVQIATVDDIATFGPEDEPFQRAVAALPDLVAAIDSQARTTFTPQRFTLEIEPDEHVYLRFAEDVSFTGQDVTWTASELVFAAPGGEAMLLARAANIEDWSVYLPADPSTITEFLDTMIAP